MVGLSVSLMDLGNGLRVCPCDGTQEARMRLKMLFLRFHLLVGELLVTIRALIPFSPRMEPIQNEKLLSSFDKCNVSFANSRGTG